MVTRFNDDLSSDAISPKHQQSSKENTITPKVNPLAKTKHRNENTTKSIDYFVERKISISSDEIDVPNVANKNANVDVDDVLELTDDKFDTWISDTNQRRSPEGGEDFSAQPSGGVDQPEKIAVHQQQLDKVPGADSDKERKHKSKKSKKEKKDRSDRDEKKEKKKKRKSKEKELEEFLNGTPAANGALDDAYEAI